VAGRHCIDKLRRGKREKNSCVAGTDLSEVPDKSTPSPLSQILRREEHRQVREQLIRLPEKYKVPLFLRYYKRMSYSEIARTLYRRLPAVRMMLFRAKDQLGQNLRRLERSQVVPGLSADGLWTKTKNGKFGYIDQHGKFVISPTFKKGFAFKAGIARVCDRTEKANPSRHAIP
jgi:hypothetical protein